ncbi:hypothetical protein PP793_004485 [Salmonella enterica]|nr:hypothetical protein [Salmonella enterica]EAP9279816.1 hypothetical protein [Salmonella enterica]EAV5428830.1 hypothetical protein [Salmonella enterica]EBH2963104.1 hypothetical protein [Salmonella enterica]EBK4512060.1 hypothetical protein [Salmonella enterica]
MSVSVAIMAESHVAKQYEADGYTVVRNPKKELIPFNLEGYTPDILATRGDENILIEVKTSKTRVNTERLFEISKIVQSHPGWKFSVVTINEDDISEFKKNASELDIDEISQTLALIQENIEKSGMSVFLVPQLWICYISILSMLLINDGIETSGLSDFGILNMAYSEGVLDFQGLESSRDFLRLRNFVCHNFAGDVNVKNVEDFFRMTLSALTKYINQISE